MVLSIGVGVIRRAMLAPARLPVLCLPVGFTAPPRAKQRLRLLHRGWS